MIRREKSGDPSMRIKLIDQTSKYARKIGLPARLLITFIIISIIPIIVIGLYSYKIYANSIKEKLGQSVTQTLNLVNSNITTEIVNYEYLCGSLCLSKKIQENLIEMLNIEVLSNNTSAEINKLIMNAYPPYTKNIRIAGKNGKILYDLGYDDISNTNYNSLIKGINECAPHDNWQYVKSYRSADLIVLGRKINSLDNSKNLLGYTFIFISESLFSKKIMSNINLTSDFLLLDRNGIVLSSTNNQTPLGIPYYDNLLFKTILEKKQENITLFDYTSNDQKFQIGYTYNENMGSYLVDITPFSYIYSEMNALTLKIIVLLIISLILCILTMVIIYTSIVKPIRQVVDFCNILPTEDMNYRIEDNCHDEMSILATNINDMVNKIQRLMILEKSDQKRKRELELQMLQYQINPHFLFNTLNTLKWLAVINQVPIVEEGIASLAELLKSTLIIKDEFITIEAELKNLEHYFSIQKIRYADSFNVNYHIKEDLLSHLIPKFILQPIAENSVIHGCIESEAKLQIDVSCHIENENTIILEIKDNGKGFDSSQFDFTEKKSKLTGIGSSNVAERLLLYFGAPYGLFINSQIGEGTTCIIKIPFQIMNKEI